MSDSETGVKHEDTLPRPPHEEPMIGLLEVLHITLQLFVYVEEAWGRLHTNGDTERHTMGLAWAMIRVLS